MTPKQRNAIVRQLLKLQSERAKRRSVQRVVSPPVETFTDSQVECAVEQFLEYGEQQYQKSHQGYYSGPGWAARCLRYHRDQLKARQANEKVSEVAGRKDQDANI